ncbi:AAEL017571-PA [Aedes aegypti]|uniref:AAEL017571-PA n=1 Tax=Aedes aegypti TaxID=7159 RepID=J9HS23_AEDAE|nr:AAEL017571-PA [Aedes aegypti]
MFATTGVSIRVRSRPVQYVSNKRKHTFECYRNRQQHKLEKLKTKQLTQNTPCDNWVLNCTDEIIPDFVTRSLQLGSGYNNPNPHSAPYVRVLSEIESAIQRNPSADVIRHDVSNAIINHIHYTKQPFHDKHENIRKEIQKSKKYLRDRDDLVVTKADKGKTVVVMKRDEYEEKMQALVNDSETYEPLASDPTKKTLKKINTLIDHWHENGFIEYSERTKLKVFNCNPPRVYGLPKTHKDGRPLRIINSAIGTATYKMAKFLSKILNHVTGKTEHHIVNSFQFAEEMREQQITNQDVLFSLDVVSLFTNVPVDFALESIRLRWEEIEEHTKLDEESFTEMVKIVLDSTYFQYKGKFYKQKFGIPMGSPISPVVANIVLERIEKDALEKLCTRGIVPRFFKRYVDDCLLCARKEEVEAILNVFNGFHQRLQFTVELEVEGKLKFLDMILRREDNTITTEWFPKDADVYEIPCGACEKSYVGETSQFLCKRLSQHNSPPPPKHTPHRTYTARAWYQLNYLCLPGLKRVVSRHSLRLGAWRLL